MKLKTISMFGLAAALCVFAAPGAGYAGETVIRTEDGKEAKKVEETKPRLQIYGWVEGGITYNPDHPSSRQNFGRLFDDRVNEPLLNQAVITAERTLDPNASGFDWGFKTQFMFGSDARFIHSMGLLDRVMKTSIYQPDIVEAYLNLHLPVLTAGGVDVKLGKFVTLEGAETIDPRTNVFYSHSYIFNFGIPFNHTGALFDIHATKVVDIYAGVTRGVNTSIEDNNASLAFHGGIGLNFGEGKVVVAATTHIGPETPHDSSGLRYLNDITTTWKINDKLTSITDLNFIHDDPADATGFGVAQYFTYAFNDKLSAGIRGEVWRDEKGFFVGQFADPHDPMRALRGEVITDPKTLGGGSTTYSAITVGVNIKPQVPKPFTGLVIRPEFRWDHSLNGTTPFNDNKDHSSYTLAVDAILTF